MNQLTIEAEKIIFSLKAESPGELPPFKGSTLHMASGTALKKLSCRNNGELCSSCSHDIVKNMNQCDFNGMIKGGVF